MQFQVIVPRRLPERSADFWEVDVPTCRVSNVDKGSSQSTGLFRFLLIHFHFL